MFFSCCNSYDCKWEGESPSSSAGFHRGRKNRTAIAELLLGLRTALLGLPPLPIAKRRESTRNALGLHPDALRVIPAD